MQRSLNLEFSIFPPWTRSSSVIHSTLYSHSNNGSLNEGNTRPLRPTRTRFCLYRVPPERGRKSPNARLLLRTRNAFKTERRKRLIAHRCPANRLTRFRGGDRAAQPPPPTLARNPLITAKKSGNPFLKSDPTWRAWLLSENRGGEGEKGVRGGDGEERRERERESLETALSALA